MVNPLQSAWRARHVLLVGPAGRPCAYMQALLELLGAKCARISPSTDAESLCRAMQRGRVSAVIVPEMRALAPQCDVFSQLSALHLLLGECRESGVPLALMLSDAAVYRAAPGPFLAREEDPVGGETHDGLVQSILQLYADGVSRGLMSDAVQVVCARHPPLLGCGHPSVAVCSRWCSAIDAGERLEVPHPGMQRLFVSPIDIFCGALLLGARYLDGDSRCTGVFNLAAGPECAAANRTAALRFSRDNGGKRPLLETSPPMTPPSPHLCGEKARRLAGARTILSSDQALAMLLSLERAARISQTAELDEIRRQAKDYLHHLI